MPTIAEQLTQLESDREDLVDNLEAKGITGLSGDETFTELVPEVLNIPSPESCYVSSYTQTSGYSNKTTVHKLIKKVQMVDTSNSTNLGGLFFECSNLEEVPLFDTSNCTSTTGMFRRCYALTSVPLLDLSSCTNLQAMFSDDSALTTVPQFNISSATNISNMFSNCSSLTNDSLNNILGMCVSATSFTGTKTLVTLFGSSGESYYPASTIQTLSNYTAFTNAGWTIGW